MSKILIINTGNRDVKLLKTIDSALDPEILAEIKPSLKADDIDNEMYIIDKQTRTISKLILDKKAEFADFLQFPILMPFLEYFESLEIKFDTVYIVTTDQNHPGDTVHFAKLIEEEMKNRKLQSTKEVAPYESIKKITVTKNPTNKEKMLDFFEAELKKKIKPEDEIFLEIGRAHV